MVIPPLPSSKTIKWPDSAPCSVFWPAPLACSASCSVFMPVPPLPAPPSGAPPQPAAIRHRHTDNMIAVILFIVAVLPEVEARKAGYRPRLTGTVEIQLFPVRFNVKGEGSSSISVHKRISLKPEFITGSFYEAASVFAQINDMAGFGNIPCFS